MEQTKPTAVPMPDALAHYWTMWNEPDPDLIRTHLDRAVSDDFVFADPMHFHRGRDALERNVRRLRADKPRYRFVIASELDLQNRCYRYRWNMMAGHRVLMRGLDIARIEENGLLGRVDGFFGEPAPTLADGSGVPELLRPPSSIG